MLERIAVDLTPLLPGGDNGGAKPLALELVRRLAQCAPECELVLLTTEKSHRELASLDAANVRRLCTSQPENAPAVSRRRALQVRRLLMKLLPAAAVEKIGRFYGERLDREPAGTSLLRQIGADLLFCPFTGVLFFDPAVPAVSLVHDLQFLYYPEFFEPGDRCQRDRHFRQVCRVASRIVCVSEATRAMVLQHSGLPPDIGRVVTVLSAPQERLPRSPANGGRPASRYLLYPANFWRHKNHEMLLAAFGMYRARFPQSDLKLALTGAPSARRDELMAAARQMGLADWVTFPGYLPDAEFAALLASSAAMIFPSLFEGFGMPVLEAMAAGVPVLAGNLTSVPEVAGGAALLFDPRRPAEIVEAIARLENDPTLRAGLIERGHRRVETFPGPAEMAAGYWHVFQEAVRHPVESAPAIYGVFADGWTSGRVRVVFGRGDGPRRLTVTLQAPAWIPAAAVTIRVSPNPEVYRIPRGQEAVIARDLPERAGSIELLCSPTFQPARCGAGGDTRPLGCRLASATIVRANGDVQPIQQADAA